LPSPEVPFFRHPSAPPTRIFQTESSCVENFSVDTLGIVSYTFRPSSFVCPIAVTLALDIKKAVSEVPEVKSQRITIEGYVMAEELEKRINEEG
jgi:metal-sulfur cluster biosynthetic enzyme